MSNVEAFTNFMHAEKTRNEAAFSLLVHVGNALSPPGVNVGSLMKAVKSAVSLPELQDEDLQSIAEVQLIQILQRLRERRRVLVLIRLCQR